MATESRMGVMRLVGGSGRLAVVRELVTDTIGEDRLSRMLPEGFTAGDTRVVWDSGRADDVEAAKATFDKLSAKGYKAYKVDNGGKKTGTPLSKFDPQAGAIIMVPQMSGGR